MLDYRDKVRAIIVARFVTAGINGEHITDTEVRYWLAEGYGAATAKDNEAKDQAGFWD